MLTTNLPKDKNLENIYWLPLYRITYSSTSLQIFYMKISRAQFLQLYTFWEMHLEVILLLHKHDKYISVLVWTTGKHRMVYFKII